MVKGGQIEKKEEEVRLVQKEGELEGVEGSAG